MVRRTNVRAPLLAVGRSSLSTRSSTFQAVGLRLSSWPRVVAGGGPSREAGGGATGARAVVASDLPGGGRDGSLAGRLGAGLPRGQIGGREGIVLGRGVVRNGLQFHAATDATRPDRPSAGRRRPEVRRRAKKPEVLFADRKWWSPPTPPPPADEPARSRRAGTRATRRRGPPTAPGGDHPRADTGGLRSSRRLRPGRRGRVSADRRRPGLAVGGVRQSGGTADGRRLVSGRLQRRGWSGRCEVRLRVVGGRRSAAGLRLYQTSRTSTVIVDLLSMLQTI